MAGEDGCWRVDFYDFTVPSRGLDGELGDVHERARRNGGRQGTPVITGPGGRVDPRVNLFFRAGAMADRSPSTWRRDQFLHPPLGVTDGPFRLDARHLLRVSGIDRGGLAGEDLLTLIDRAGQPDLLFDQRQASLCAPRVIARRALRPVFALACGVGPREDLPGIIHLLRMTFRSR